MGSMLRSKKGQEALLVAAIIGAVGWLIVKLIISWKVASILDKPTLIMFGLGAFVIYMLFRK